MATQKDFRVKNGIIVGDSADISNDLTVNSDTLYVDSANGRVGVGTTSPSSALDITGNVTVTGSVDGRDIASDGSKLDGIESGADVTDTSNVTAAGALMDSELTNESAVKNIDQELTTTDSPTFSGITTSGGDITVDQAKLKEIAESKSDSPVDVFVYDTSRDFDGGAWRKRTQHTSWYNEDLNTSDRGSRREFPAVAVIVAETDKVTIYDGDDPALPMWMGFTGDGVATEFQTIIHSTAYNSTAITMLNGVMFLTSKRGSDSNLFNYGPRLISFIDEKVLAWTGTGGARTWLLGIKDRNINSGTPYSSQDGISLVNNNANDVAMTVLPGAPIDEATGLPVPTIAVGTELGASIIHNDGSVVDIGPTGGGNAKVTHTVFDNHGALWLNRGFEGNSLFGIISVWDPLPFSDTSEPADGQSSPPPSNTFNVFADVSLSGFRRDPIDTDDRRQFMRSSPIAASTRGEIIFQRNGNNPVGNDNVGITRLLEDVSDRSGNSLVCYQTTQYNSGWQPPRCLLAALSDTDDTDVTGNELNTDPNFDSGVGIFIAATGTVTHSSGTITSTKNSGGNSAMTSSEVLTVGKAYYIEFEITDVSPGYTHIDSPIGEITSGQVGTHSGTFIAGSTTVNFGQNNGGSTSSVTFTRISIRLAEEDRSVNNNGLIINGTVTREPVAPGADLVAYSGFSSSNYLEQPYNPDLDFGTGDFCVMGWLKCPIDGTGLLLVRSSNNGENGHYWYITGGGNISTRMGTGNSVDRSTNATVDNDTWIHFVVTRRSGVLYRYFNAELDSTINLSGDFDVQEPLQLGGGDAAMALWRISATAPTDEQIKKIYEDEKFLFQENAQATLYGSSDAVTALAHDEVTDLLHVGTSDGRSVFQGLRRVDNTTTGVNVIDAHDSMIIEG